jgi:hypothetical protein
MQCYRNIVTGRDTFAPLGRVGRSGVHYDPWPPKVGKIDWRSLADWYAGGTNPAGQPDSSRDGGAGVTAVFLHCP